MNLMINLQGIPHLWQYTLVFSRGTAALGHLYAYVVLSWDLHAQHMVLFYFDQSLRLV